MNEFQHISPSALHELLKTKPDIKVIDVRTPAEYRDVHAPFARLAPLESLKPQEVLSALLSGADDTLYVFCGTGSRAGMACQKFLAAGASSLCIVEGGIKAWEAGGFEVVRGKKIISLERQVRIAAGSLVLTGVALGFGVHPGFFGLSAFVGAGLVFAGITDTCGMGMLLARMPWNQAGGEAGGACRS